MSKTKLLFTLAADMRNLASSLQTLAESMPCSEADGEAAAEAGTQSNEEKPQCNAKERTITLEDVRAVLADKSVNGFTGEIRELLKKHGADKLSEIDASKYAELLSDAETLK
jgi:hypothetical protein